MVDCQWQVNDVWQVVLGLFFCGESCLTIQDQVVLHVQYGGICLSAGFYWSELSLIQVVLIPLMEQMCHDKTKMSLLEVQALMVEGEVAYTLPA